MRQVMSTTFYRLPSPQKRPRSWFLVPQGILSQYACFPLTRPDWDYNTAEGRERLLVYHRTLVAGLKGAAW